jgi:hypothetical protein
MTHIGLCLGGAADPNTPLTSGNAGPGRRVVALVPGAIETLGEIVYEQAAPATTRLRACEVILASGGRPPPWNGCRVS